MLIDCLECGKNVSDTVKTCPNCGAKVPKKSKGASRLTVFFGGLIVIVVAMSVANQKADLSPEDKKVKDEASAKDFARHKFASASANILKLRMRDPDSFFIESMLINELGTIACVEYRSKNGFGGMNRDSAVVIKNVSYNAASEWNKNCAGKHLFNYSKDM